MEVDDIVKLILAVSFSVSMVGISVQLMRIMGTLNDTLQDFRYLAYKIGDLLSSIANDYNALKERLTNMSDSVSRLNQSVVSPVSRLAVSVGAAADVLRRKIQN